MISLSRRRGRRRSTFVVALIGATVLMTAPPAAARQPAGPVGGSGNAVVDGSARFEVLTPTLVRMEYAADGHFQNGPTFNVVNRNLPVPAYSSRHQHGWLVLRTGQLTVRYRDGSGPFTPANTTVTLDVAGRQTSAAGRPPCSATAKVVICPPTAESDEPSQSRR